VIWTILLGYVRHCCAQSVSHLALPFPCLVKGPRAVQQLHIARQWTSHSFQVLPSTVLSHFLLSIHLGRGSSRLDCALGGACAGRPCLPREPRTGAALGLQGSAVGNSFAPATVAAPRARPVGVGVCTCMGLGGWGSRSPALPGAQLLDWFLRGGAWPWTAGVSWEAGAFPQGQGITE